MNYTTRVKIDGIGRLRTANKSDRHTAKSHAGKLFHNPLVKFVRVCNESGGLSLYLSKTKKGITRKEVKE